MEPLIQIFLEKHQELFSLFIDHLNLTIAAVLVACVIGIPLGFAITRSNKAAGLVIGVANVLQSIPCIALLAFSVPFIGIGAPSAILMVVVYALLPILKNTYMGVTGIDPKLSEVARGMGMNSWEYLRIVEWPLALPYIMAGVRIATVASVGTMTIAAFAGAGGLGWYINLGLNAQNNYLVLLGAIPASVMAVGLDVYLGWVEKLVTSNIEPEALLSTSNSRKARMRRRLQLVGVTVIALVLLSSPVGSLLHQALKKNDSNRIVIGTANFTEALLLGTIVGDLIENQTNLKVERRFNLNGEGMCYAALDAGKIDVFTGYSGAVLMNYLHQPLFSKDPVAVLAKTRELLASEKGISSSGPFGFSNTYVMTVTEDKARQYGLHSVKDLMAAAPHLRIGATVDFMQREDGLSALVKAYKSSGFQSAKGLDGTLRYRALQANEVDVVDAFSTDGLLEKLKAVPMADTDHFFPPYDAFAMMRNVVITEHPQLQEVLQKLNGLISEAEMRHMNYLVDVQGQDIDAVARDFLKEKKLLH